MSKHPFLGKFPEEVGCQLSPIIRDYLIACKIYLKNTVGAANRSTSMKLLCVSTVIKYSLPPDVMITTFNHDISVSIRVSAAWRSENVPHVAQAFTYCLISTDMLG